MIRRFLNTKQASALVPVSAKTLTKARREGWGPAYVEILDRYWYEQPDLYEWIDNVKTKPTRVKPERKVTVACQALPAAPAPMPDWDRPPVAKKKAHKRRTTPPPGFVHLRRMPHFVRRPPVRK